MNNYIAWFDGACAPCNPGGTATSGAIVKDDKGAVLLKESCVVGQGAGMSNNVAEYAAVIGLVEYLRSCPPGQVIVHGDSRLVINQLKGEWGVNGGLYRSVGLEAQHLLAQLRNLGWQVDLQWIPRTQNEECDALSKRSLADPGVLGEIPPSSSRSEPVLPN